MNEKGKAPNKWLVVALGIAIILIVIYYFGGTMVEAVKSAQAEGFQTIGATLNVAGDRVWGPIATFAGFVFGEVPNSLLASSNGPASAVIVIIALTGLIALTFGDIIKNFSSFGEGTSWAIGITLAIIAANLKVSAYLILGLTSIFLPLGVFAVYGGLFASFAAFFVVEWGIGSLAPWIMRRKSMQESAKAKETTGTILNAIQSYRQVGEEISRKSSKS